MIYLTYIFIVFLSLMMVWQWVRTKQISKAIVKLSNAILKFDDIHTNFSLELATRTGRNESYIKNLQAKVNKK